MHTIIADAIPQPVLFLIERLKKAHHQAFIVGGAVRDLCLNRSVTDWDLATSAPVPVIQRLFKDNTQFTPGTRHGNHYGCGTFI